MISRVAGNCFWLGRYVERVGSMARLLRVNRAFVPGASLPNLQRWFPLVVVSGEQERYERFHGRDEDDETVQEYLTWDTRNPASLLQSVKGARENARTAREILSSEMWETINALWHWLQSGPGRRLYRSDRDRFYQHVREMSELFHGQAEETMLNGEPWAFMRLGRHLERTGQTARLMDVHYHTFPEGDEPDDPIRLARWSALLACCSAIDAFKKHSHGTPQAKEVVGFLLYEEDLPRSIACSLRQARHALVQVRGYGDNRVGSASSSMLEELLTHNQSRAECPLVGSELHEELTYLVDSLGELSDSIEEEFFHAVVLEPRAADGDSLRPFSAEGILQQ